MHNKKIDSRQLRFLGNSEMYDIFRNSKGEQPQYICIYKCCTAFIIIYIFLKYASCLSSLSLPISKADNELARNPTFLAKHMELYKCVILLFR